MLKTLFVHFHDLTDSCGGSRRAYQNLRGCMSNTHTDTRQTYGETLTPPEDFSIPDLKAAMFISPFECAALAAIIKKYHYDIVFFDTSLYGDAVAFIKDSCPGVKTVVHCHNFEKKYFEDQEKTGIPGPSSRYISLCERISLQAADRIVFISENDRELITTEYGLSPERSTVIPPALADQYKPCPVDKNAAPYVLFLGSAFFANLEAARYLMREVAPKVNKKVVIAGSGMGCLKDEAGVNTEIMDFVPHLAELMNGACAFISPVFFGSGAKIKIAEALMYGKYLISTADSLQGYDCEKISASVCETTAEFIRAINGLNPDKRFYSENREIFLRDHALNNGEKQYAFLKELK